MFTPLYVSRAPRIPPKGHDESNIIFIKSNGRKEVTKGDAQARFMIDKE
jgi:hypothetical protein